MRICWGPQQGGRYCKTCQATIADSSPRCTAGKARTAVPIENRPETNHTCCGCHARRQVRVCADGRGIQGRAYVWSKMVKHLSATNHILAAAALGEEPPADAGDEVGPEAVRTKAEILNYLNDSFAHLSKAIEAIGQTNASVNPSPISPLKKGEVTRSALVVEALIDACDHYGQIVEYLRMNGVVPPASRP
jgi:hypothetical protein